MKSNFLILLVSAIGLIGCSKNSAAGGTNGKVDCYSIRVTEGSSIVFNETYNLGYSEVHEYKSADGKKIYTSNRFLYIDHIDDYPKDSVIRAFPDKYTNDYTEYSYSRFVGFLTVENNFYLDLGARTIDSEIKWSEYKYASVPAFPDGISNNKEAYSCAKSNYYLFDNISSNTQYVSLRLELTESSLERHTYTMLGQDSIITYKAKWF